MTTDVYNKPSHNKDDYENEYEYRRQWLGCFEKDEEMEYYPKSFSFFCKSNGTPISGKVAKIKPVEFKATMNIKDAFALLKAAMHTKSGSLRKNMLELKPFEEYLLISLINYLREEWVDGNRGAVELTWKEYFFLREGGFKKNTKKKK